MRLTLKLTLVLSIVIACALAAQAFMHVQRVRALHVEEARDDLTILARTLGSATGEIWRLQGEAYARQYVAKADERRARTRIRVVDNNVGPAGFGTGPSEPEVREDVFVSYVPVLVRGQPVARIELVRTRRAQREFSRRLVWTQFATVAAVVGACGVLALFLGFWLVGRPVEELIAHARRVARGDFTAMKPVGSRDELGRLAAELNVMTSDLASAEARARQERQHRATAYEQLRHADRLSTVGKIASGIAHELGTPLNVVTGRAAMISTSPDATDAIRKSADAIVAHSERMTDILRQLLDFSRRRGLTKGSDRPRDILSRTALLVEPLADDHGVSIDIVDAVDDEVTLDSGKTLQVLSNLVVNAIQAMPDGGTVRLGAELIDVDRPPDRHAAPGRFVSFTVRDQGTGIATEDLDRIFEPFFTTKEVGDGTGLGLSVSHGIVREHGGWIEVESEPGEGSSFRVCLPAGGIQ